MILSDKTISYKNEPESRQPFYGDPFDRRLDTDELEAQVERLRQTQASRRLAEHLEDLGVLFANRGDVFGDKAESYLVEALVTWKLVEPPDHPCLAMANARMASFYRGLNQASQAAFYQAQAVEIMEALVQESRQPAYVTNAYLARMHEDLAYYYRKTDRTDLANRSAARAKELQS